MNRGCSGVRLREDVYDHVAGSGNAHGVRRRRGVWSGQGRGAFRQLVDVDTGIHDEG